MSTINTIMNENSNNNKNREYVVLSHPYDGCAARLHGYEGCFPTEEEAVSYCKAHVMSHPELEYTIIIMDHEDAEQIKNCDTETADRTAHEYDWHDWYNTDNTTKYLVISMPGKKFSAGDPYGCEDSFASHKEAKDYIEKMYQNASAREEYVYHIVEMDAAEIDNLDGWDSETAEEILSSYEDECWTPEDFYKYVLWMDHDDDTADDLCTWEPGEIDEDDITEDTIYDTLVWMAQGLDEEIEPTTYYIDKMIGYETVEEICRLLPYEIIERNEKRNNY